MAEPQTASQGSSLRRLVPRIFSRAPRINDLDNLIRTVRAVSYTHLTLPTNREV